jgi:sporulation protein YlmC with PRC-barrel domain
MKVVSPKKERPVSLEAPQVMSSSDLINDEVTNNAGETLGRLERFMIDLSSGRVLYAVMSHGSLLGPRKFIAVPWEILSFSHHDKRFILNIAKDRLNEAPAFQQERWPEQADPAWVGNMYQYYGLQAPKMGPIEKRTHQGLPASSLLNATVVDSQGQVIGKLKDLFIDLKNSQIIFAAITTGSILGMDNKYYALPSNILTIQEDKLMVNAAKEQLEGGPSFEKDNWPDVNDEKWTRNLYDYYQVDRNA